MERRWRGDFFAATRLDRARDVGGIDVDGEQERPDLVMEIAGDVAAFLLLQRQQLAGEPPILFRHAAQFPRHAVEAVAQARQFGGQTAFQPRAVIAAADRCQRRVEPAERPQRPADKHEDQDNRHAPRTAPW